MNALHSAFFAGVTTLLAASTAACATTVGELETAPELTETGLAAPTGFFKFTSCNSDALCPRGQYCAVDGGSTWGRCKLPGRNGFACASDRNCSAGFSCTNVGGPYSQTLECRSNQNRTCVSSRECGRGLTCVAANANYGVTLSCQSPNRGRACQLDEDCGASSCIVGIYQAQGTCN